MTTENTNNPPQLPAAADFEAYFETLFAGNIEALTLEDLKIMLVSAKEAKPIDRVDDIVVR